MGFEIWKVDIKIMIKDEDYDDDYFLGYYPDDYITSEELRDEMNLIEKGDMETLEIYRNGDKIENSQRKL